MVLCVPAAVVAVGSQFLVGLVACLVVVAVAAAVVALEALQQR